MSFGVTIPVTTLNVGFLGAVTRIGKRTITARQVVPTSVYANAVGPNFGDPCVIVANGSGGGDTLWSVADFINNGGTFTAALFAGVAVREVKTNLSYIAFETLGGTQIGQYAPGSMAELLEEGSCAVKINVGTPASQGPVYVRISANGGNTIIGGFEAASDTTHTVELTGVVFRTGVMDGNNVAEITILNRVAA